MNKFSVHVVLIFLLWLVRKVGSPSNLKGLPSILSFYNLVKTPFIFTVILHYIQLESTASLQAAHPLITTKLNYDMKMMQMIFYDCCPPLLQDVGGKITNYI